MTRAMIARHLAFGLVAGLFLLAMAACDRNRAGDDAALPSSDPSPEHGAAPQSRAPEVQKTPDVEGLGEVCREDDTCPGYLRCLQMKCSIPQAISGEHDASTPVVTFRKGRDQASDELVRFHVELAISDFEQRRGLMYRRSMLDDWGMLFIYPGDLPLRFWMKNTLISLDMVFIHSSGEVVGVIEGAEPLTLEPRGVGKHARYVLELGAGIAARHGIEAGTWMSVTNVAETDRPQP